MTRNPKHKIEKFHKNRKTLQLFYWIHSNVCMKKKSHSSQFLDFSTRFLNLITFFFCIQFYHLKNNALCRLFHPHSFILHFYVLCTQINYNQGERWFKAITFWIKNFYIRKSHMLICTRNMIHSWHKIYILLKCTTLWEWNVPFEDANKQSSL